MARKSRESAACQICGKQKRLIELLPAELVRAPVVEIIRRTHPSWDPGGYICMTDLNRFRADFIHGMMEAEKGELTALDEQVVTSMKEYEILASNMNVEFEQKLTVGEKAADRIASFGGSWRFIIIFGAVMAAWVALNSVFLVTRPFDPYPYIFLNLVLSCLAAIQAPIIMMSQNRQESRDRMRAEHDYRVNLKAELEIRYLHEKLDHLLTKQWQRLVEIQEIQMDIMEELSRAEGR